jgi:hypothetical protein
MHITTAHAYMPVRVDVEERWRLVELVGLGDMINHNMDGTTYQTVHHLHPAKPDTPERQGCDGNQNFQLT